MIHFRLYLDENAMRSALAIALREAGVDVLTALEANTLGYKDEDRLIFAREKGRVLYSLNVVAFIAYTVFL